jgi:hypothetical protein
VIWTTDIDVAPQSFGRFRDTAGLGKLIIAVMRHHLVVSYSSRSERRTIQCKMPVFDKHGA